MPHGLAYPVIIIRLSNYPNMTDDAWIAGRFNFATDPLLQMSLSSGFVVPCSGAVSSCSPSRLERGFVILFWKFVTQSGFLANDVRANQSLE